MLNLPTLRVLAAVLLIGPDDPDDADDLEAAGLLLARRVGRRSGPRALPNRRACVLCGDRRGTLVGMAVLMRRPWLLVTIALLRPRDQTPPGAPPTNKRAAPNRSGR
jgi:hypothetical protein